MKRKPRAPMYLRNSVHFYNVCYSTEEQPPFIPKIIRGSAVIKLPRAVRTPQHIEKVRDIIRKEMLKGSKGPIVIESITKLS